MHWNPVEYKYMYGVKLDDMKVNGKSTNVCENRPAGKPCLVTFDSGTSLMSVPGFATKKLIEQGIHVASGLIAAEGYELVNQNCGNCHSYKLVTQNRNTKEGWLETIRWMQETQKLWDLGENEDPLLNYLSTNYGPEETGRRKQLVVTEWYQLN